MVVRCSVSGVKPRNHLRATGQVPNFRLPWLRCFCRGSRLDAMMVPMMGMYVEVTQKNSGRRPLGGKTPSGKLGGTKKI